MQRISQIKDTGKEDEAVLLSQPSSIPVKRNYEIVWPNLIITIILHLAGLYGFYIFLFKGRWLTSLYVHTIGHLVGLGVTAGAHRLWAHKSYKARLPLQIILITLNTMCIQAPVIEWVRDHRMHHKYSETDADPHNSKRGFFFAHIGWLLVRKHPDIKAKGKTIDISDITNDPILRFQKRYYALLAPTVGFMLPSYVATLWGESWFNAIFVLGFYRYLCLSHVTYLVNSAAHLWGVKPYNKNINPAENITVTVLALGEGYHNYHHTFPWDYKTAELGRFFNTTTVFIDFMAKIGWAYDLKTVSTDIIRQRIKRTGDGSHALWGWSDKELSVEDRKLAVTLNAGPNTR